MAEKDLPGFDAAELGDFLLEEGVSTDVVSNFEKNLITGKAFLELTEDDLKELVPIIGLRTQIRGILKNVS